MNQSTTDINTRAMLVTLSTSTFNPSKLDRSTTAEVTTAKGAAKDAGEYRKKMIPKAVIDPVLKAANEVYLTHKMLTRPWEDGGSRLLCIDLFDRYNDEINGGRRLFEIEVEKFLKHYEDIRATAPVRMGATYDPRDFPDIAEVRARFAIRTVWTPLPKGSDFRLHLQDDDLNELAASVDSRVAAAVGQARAENHDLLKEKLEKVSERLSKPEHVFRDTLIENLREVCTLLPQMCITPDPELARAVDAAVQGVAKYDPQELRDDLDKRAAAKRAADEILRTMGGAFAAPTVAA